MTISRQDVYRSDPACQDFFRVRLESVPSDELMTCSKLAEFPTENWWIASETSI